jgi:hypothetical protein
MAWSWQGVLYKTGCDHVPTRGTGSEELYKKETTLWKVQNYRQENN